MSLWIIHSGRVHMPTDEATRALGIFDVRDLDDVEPGWLEQPDGSFREPVIERPPVPSPITYKADLYRRCTDSEAEAIEMALAAAPVRERRLFESAQYLDHAAPEVGTLREHLEGMFGKPRAAELLAPSV